MAFNLQRFVDNPTLEVTDKCRKDELLKTAALFKIVIPKKKIKDELILEF